MAATNHTTNLGLCSWTASDKPKRSDFVADNNAIDAALGTHIVNTDIHVTAQEKAAYSTPYSVIRYVGDGNATKAVALSGSPRLAIVYQQNKPFCMTNASGNTVAYAGIVFFGIGGTYGLSLSSSTLTVSQSTTATDGKIPNFNEEYGQYVAVLFR